MNNDQYLNMLKKACDEYITALSTEAYNYKGDDWIEYAEKIVGAALVLIYDGPAILIVESALKNYHEFKRLKGGA